MKQCEPCLPTINKILVSYQPLKMDIKELINRGCNELGVTFEEISTKSRKRHLVEPRQMVMAVLANNTKFSLKMIGQTFGGRDHTTAIHSRETVKDLCDVDKDYKERYLRLKREMVGL